MARETSNKKRRLRSPHPGVKLKKRVYPTTDTVTWYARWKDPDSGKVKDTNLTKLQLTSEERRVTWAKRKSAALALRRAELATGAPRRTETKIATASKEFFDGAASRLRPDTINSYKRTWKHFREWVGARGIRYIEEIDQPTIARFREYACSVHRKVARPGGKRGQRECSGRPRSPTTVNSDLREVRTILNRLRKLGYTPLLTRDQISEGLESIPGARPMPRPLSASRCRDLLLAALRHDIATFALTREEHAAFPSATALNQTARYRPISPFVLFVLMTGARVGEALQVRWRDVDLDAPDDFGRSSGEIILEPTATKTRIGRRIGLEVSPALRSMLLGMKLRAGDSVYVFGDSDPPKRWRMDAARKRLVKSYGAPEFTWQRLRQTTASFLTNAPGIFRSASIFRSAAQLGHSPSVATRHYLNVIRGIRRDATTLEDAMRIADVTDQVIALARGHIIERATVDQLARNHPRATGTA